MLVQFWITPLCLDGPLVIFRPGLVCLELIVGYKLGQVYVFGCLLLQIWTTPISFAWATLRLRFTF